MDPISSAQNSLSQWGARVRSAWFAWWHVLLLGAQIVVLALSPSSYRHGERRAAVLRNLYLATAPLLTWFLVLSALVSVVLIRIVVATAYSYGLTQYALEVLVRTLVLELIPLYAALFVALRYAMPGAQVVRKKLSDQHRAGGEVNEQALLRGELLPRSLAAVFSVLLLAALSCVVALVLTYLTVYGFSPWGLPAYTRSVGGVFTPAVTLIFTLKTLFFSMAVAVVPLAASAQRDSQGRYSRRSDISEFARLFSVVLLIEVVSLVGNYY
ncbi:ABC transporter permease [Hydrogenophaga sp.]|uniref:MlaE family ABC transporter permease n=1 Tax=Hydrogenophaga sp. TaxID=1904254 RepID=UPI0025BFF9F9|nr:ABC transporter permease [Hydrogenophaga sp.]